MRTHVLPQLLLAVWLISIASIGYGGESFNVADFSDKVQPLLEQHCQPCHGGDSVEAGVDFSKMVSPGVILGEVDLWRRTREVLQEEAMPPEAELSEFGTEERELLVRWIKEAVEGVDLSSDQFRHPGPSFVRQLTAYEYMRTVRDLLYLEDVPFGRLGLEQDYPQEGLEYVNQSLGVTLSPFTFDRYLRTGEQVLKQLFGDETGTWRKTGNLHRRYRKAAEAARQKVLFVQPGVSIDEKSDEMTEEDAAKRVLQRLARRAFRRPLKEREVADLMLLFKASRNLGGNYQQSLQSSMTAVLASPHFLLRIEEDRPSQQGGVYAVSPHELATRLSYFLWSSMPDERLRQKANSGILLDDKVLENEVERMLQNERAAALTDHFARQWLQLRLMELPSIPDRKGFPKLTREVQAAFKQELRTFVERMRTEDHSILDFLDSEYTYVNSSLASFYGLPDTSLVTDSDDEMIRVDLNPSDHRGGLLGMGGVLWMTSHESRTKPTARGKWILEVILGTPPPPPPPEAGSFAPPEDGQPEPETFRDKLEQHAADAACIGCHRKIDPLGFALENFDAIGSWRDDVAGDPVDNVGHLPTGESFKGFEGLQEVIAGRKAQFVRNFASQMLRYALGRELLYSDRGTVELIARRVETNEYRFSEVVKGIVFSRAFRCRVNAAVGGDR